MQKPTEKPLKDMANFTQNAKAHIILLEQSIKSEQTTVQCKTQGGHSHVHNTYVCNWSHILKIDWRPKFVCDSVTPLWPHSDPTVTPLLSH